MTNEIIVTGYDSPEEQKAIDGAISILKSMGMLAKYPKEDCENFVRACAIARLNPILKQVYPVPYWNTEAGRYVLGVIPDYKTFLSRAERSGKLDGWQTEFEGEIIKSQAVKKAKNKDGSWREYTVDVINRSQTTLRGRITIWRKDQSRPFVSRWMRLVDEMKDTPFWHDDGVGQLEKNLIREYFDKIFPIDCDLPDYSKEVHATDYEVLDESPKTIEISHKEPPIELANALRTANRLMGEFSMLHSVKEGYDQNLKAAYQAGDIGTMEALISELEAMKQKAVDAMVAQRKPMPDEEPEQETCLPVNNAELDKLRADIVKGLNSLSKAKVDRFDQPSRRTESMKKHLGVETLAECTDIPKLKDYLEHLRDKYRNKDDEAKDLKTEARNIIDALPEGYAKEYAENCFREASVNGAGYELIISTDWSKVKLQEEK